MNTEQFNLLNEKIRKWKEKNRIFHQQKDKYNSLFKNNNFIGTLHTHTAYNPSPTGNLPMSNNQRC